MSTSSAPRARVALRFTAALLGSLFASPFAGAAATQAPDIVPSRANNVYIGNSGGPVSTGDLIVSGSGTAPRKAYIKVNVPAGHMNNGRPKPGTAYTAVLKITTVGSHTSTPGNIVVSAANNNWGGFTSWSSAPKVTTQLKKAGANVGGNITLSFDVSDYISGPGTYTFCVTAEGSTANQSFHSSDTTTANFKPQLELKYEPDPTGSDFSQLITYHSRTVPQAWDAGVSFIARYKLSNATGAADVEQFGYFDATKEPYNLSPSNGALANYYALQRCVNEARDARVAVYIPAGTYTLDKQIELIQGIVDQENVANTDTYRERWDHWDFPCVVIGNNHPTNRTVLKAQGGAFTDANTPTAMLYYWARFNTNGGDPRKNKAASHFNAALVNVDFDLNTQAGAIAVDMGGAQGCMIRDVNVTGTTFFAGFHALPSAGGITHNISVTGGKYGIYASTHSSAPDVVQGDIAFSNTVVAAKLSGQSDYAVYCANNQAFTFVGSEIYTPTAGSTPFYAGGTGALRGNISIVECRIDRAAGGLLIEGNRSFYIRDTYVKNSNTLSSLTAAQGTGTRPAVSTGNSNWNLIQEYYDGTYNKMTDRTSETIKQVPSYFNRASTAARHSNLVTNITNVPPAWPHANSLMARHRAPDTPRWDAGDVMTAYNYPNLIADGTMPIPSQSQTPVNLSTTAMRDLIEDAVAANKKAIFFPRGEYVVNGTIDIPNNLILFGINKAYTRIKAAPDVAGMTTRTPLMVAGVGNASDKMATTMLADLTLITRQDDIRWYLLQWKVGRHSVVKDCNFDNRHVGANWAWNGGDPKSGALVAIETANGGGRWYNLWNDSDGGQTEHTYNHFLIKDTREPLSIYQLNVETDQNTPGILIQNARYFDIYGTKWETKLRDGTPPEPNLKVESSQQFKIFGFGGNSGMNDAGADMMTFTSCTDFLMAHQNYQGSYQSSGGSFGSAAFLWFNDNGFETTRWEQFVMYRVDQPHNFLARASTAGEDGYVQSGVITSNGDIVVGNRSGGALATGVVSFDTSVLAGNVTIKSIKLRLKVKARTMNGGTTDMKVDVFSGPISGNAALQTSDVSATGAAGTVTVAHSGATVANGWWEVTITGAIDSMIGKGANGITQIRLTTGSDTGGNNGLEDTITFWGGEAASEQDRPTLDVTYANPQTN